MVDGFIYHEYVEGRGEISSMDEGWKFIEDKVFERGHHQAPNPVAEKPFPEIKK